MKNRFGRFFLPGLGTVKRAGCLLLSAGLLLGQGTLPGSLQVYADEYDRMVWNSDDSGDGTGVQPDSGQTDGEKEGSVSNSGWNQDGTATSGDSADDDYMSWQYTDDGAGAEIVKYVGSATSIDVSDYFGSGEVPVVSIGKEAFSQSSVQYISLPRTLTSIGEDAFWFCRDLKEIEIPNNVTSIGMSAFAGCNSLEWAVLPSKLQKMDSLVFQLCRKLRYIEFPSGLTKLPYGVLSECSSLTSVTIPEGVTEIGNNAFEGCTSLEQVVYNGTDEQWAKIKFGSGNEELLRVKPIQQEQKSLSKDSNASITLSQNTYVYDGRKKEPDVTVSLDGKTLVRGTDYTVSYSDNLEVGTASVVVTGKGDYTGSRTLNFTITKEKDLSAATVTLSETSYTYDGKKKEPGVTVKLGGRTLSQGTDYLVTYSNNTEVGTAQVLIMGYGDYIGSMIKEFKIEKAAVTSLTSATVSLTSSAKIEYTGTAKTPAVKVVAGGKTLTADTDYTLSYSNNQNAGNATVTVTGKGKYSGTKSLSFTINPKSITSAKILVEPNPCTYDGTPQKPQVTVVLDSKVISSGTDYTASYSDNTEIGTATVSVTGKGNYTGTATGSFSIQGSGMSKSYDLEDAVVSLSSDSFKYDGYSKEPGVTVTLNNTVLSSSDYSVSYSNNTDATDYAMVYVTGEGAYSGSQTKYFEIKRASISGAKLSLSAKSYTYTGYAREPGVDVTLGGNYLYSWDYDVSYKNSKGPGTATVVVKGKGNYTGMVKANYKIKAPKITSVKLSKTEYTYDGGAKKPSVVVKTSAGKLSSSYYSVSYAGGRRQVGSYKVTVKFKGAFSSSKSEKLSFKILPPKISIHGSWNRNIYTVRWSVKEGYIYVIRYTAKGQASRTIEKKGKDAYTDITAPQKGSTIEVCLKKEVGGKNYQGKFSKITI